jgi:hypothetical protein
MAHRSHSVGIAFLVIFMIASVFIFTSVQYVRASLVEIQEQVKAQQ